MVQKIESSAASKKVGDGSDGRPRLPQPPPKERRLSQQSPSAGAASQPPPRPEPKASPFDAGPPGLFTSGKGAVLSGAALGNYLDQLSDTDGKGGRAGSDKAQDSAAGKGHRVKGNSEAGKDQRTKGKGEGRKGKDAMFRHPVDRVPQRMFDAKRDQLDEQQSLLDDPSSVFVQANLPRSAQLLEAMFVAYLEATNAYKSRSQGQAFFAQWLARPEADQLGLSAGQRARWTKGLFYPQEVNQLVALPCACRVQDIAQAKGEIRLALPANSCLLGPPLEDIKQWLIGMGATITSTRHFPKLHGIQRRIKEVLK
jgi:hypothetical protein